MLGLEEEANIEAVHAVGFDYNLAVVMVVPECGKLADIGGHHIAREVGLGENFYLSLVRGQAMILEVQDASVLVDA